MAPVTEALGFVIGRHIADASHGDLCFRAYSSIRRFYPDSPVVIVDDSSPRPDLHAYDARTTVIQSARRGSGEFGLYHHFHVGGWFDRAVLMHDSMVINQRLVIPDVPITYLWHFPAEAALDSVVKDVKKFIGRLENKRAAKRKYTSRSWLGMFGCASIVTWSCLDRVAARYDLFGLLRKVDTRPKRCAMERILGIVFDDELDKHRPSLNGSIVDLPGFGTRATPLPTHNGAMDKTWHGR